LQIDANKETPSFLRLHKLRHPLRHRSIEEDNMKSSTQADQSPENFSIPYKKLKKHSALLALPRGLCYQFKRLLRKLHLLKKVPYTKYQYGTEIRRQFKVSPNVAYVVPNPDDPIDTKIPFTPVTLDSKHIPSERQIRNDLSVGKEVSSDEGMQNVGYIIEKNVPFSKSDRVTDRNDQIGKSKPLNEQGQQMSKNELIQKTDLMNTKNDLFQQQEDLYVEYPDQKQTFRHTPTGLTLRAPPTPPTTSDQTQFIQSIKATQLSAPQVNDQIQINEEPQQSQQHQSELQRDAAATNSFDDTDLDSTMNNENSRVNESQISADIDFLLADNDEYLPD